LDLRPRGKRKQNFGEKKKRGEKGGLVVPATKTRTEKKERRKLSASSGKKAVPSRTKGAASGKTTKVRGLRCQKKGGIRNDKEQEAAGEKRKREVKRVLHRTLLKGGGRASGLENRLGGKRGRKKKYGANN